MSEDRCQRVRLYLVRHGETASNREMRYLGTRDDPLTEHGIWQADQVAKALSQLSVAAVYSSPMRRAEHTAAAITAACNLETRLDRRLIEGSFGDWEGLRRSDVIQLSPKDAVLLARWESDPAFSPPGGESMREVQDRVLSLIQELEHDHPASSVVLVSHVGPIKALLAAALAIPLQASRRLFLDPCTMSVIDWGERPIVRLFNSHAHLGWPAARWMSM